MMSTHKTDVCQKSKLTQGQGQIWNYNTTKNYQEYNSKSLTDYWILMIHIMMDINEHQDQRYTRGDNNGRDLYLLGVNVLVTMMRRYSRCDGYYVDFQGG